MYQNNTTFSTKQCNLSFKKKFLNKYNYKRTKTQVEAEFNPHFDLRGTLAAPEKRLN